MPTANISESTNLVIDNKFTTDLTGIQDFTTLSSCILALVAYRTNYLVSTKFILIEIITIFIST